MKLDLIVERYVLMRDRLAEMKAAYDASTADIKAGMAKLEGAIMDTLNKQGVESVRTNAGTASKSVSTSATIADWDAYLDFVKANDRWDMLEKRCVKLAVEQYRAANDDLPPGVNWKSAVTVNVRRA
jgi:phage shock protein A